VVTIRQSDGSRRDVYLGEFNSPNSRREYGRLVTELSTASLPALVTNPSSLGSVSIDEVLLAFWRHAEVHYRRADGTPTHELVEYRQSFKPLRQLYGHTAAKDFGSLALKAVRAKMIERGLCRRLINQRVGRIRRVFKWAAAEQIIPVTTYPLLTTLPGLQKGRSEARDLDSVEPVSAEHVLATILHLPRPIRGMVEFEMLTGCRPGEACSIRPIDVDTTGPVWMYRPGQHKNSWRGKSRVVAIGPQAQMVLFEFAPSERTDHFFSPARSVAEFHAERTANRKTPLFPSHVRRNKAKRKPKPALVPATAYTSESYGRAIARAVRKANAEFLESGVELDLHIPHWHPNQLRHLHATEVRRRFGLEAAQVALGHQHARVTEIYAEKNQSLAAEVALVMG
jgi:integrase